MFRVNGFWGRASESRECAGDGAATVEACRALLERFEVAPDQFQVGRTKLFFRAGVLGRLEDAAARINRSAPCQPLQPCAAFLMQVICCCVHVQANWLCCLDTCLVALFLARAKAADWHVAT